MFGKENFSLFVKDTINIPTSTNLRQQLEKSPKTRGQMHANTHARKQTRIVIVLLGDL